ncbi:MAG: GHKL domain-containing protein [Deltaproteobacteria bacterium]|nr:GHKL domain-containing protein [Deltaproteobacteria bacterium]
MAASEDKPEVAINTPLRGGSDALRSSSTLIDANVTLGALLEAMPTPAVVLDHERRVVAANHRVQEQFGDSLRVAFAGKRFGELIGCTRPTTSPSGCGSASACAWCGVMSTVNDSMRHNAAVTAECRLALDPSAGGSLDIEVRATPLALGARKLTVLTLRDISAEKRRRVLERIFFHDVLNTAGGICGIANVLAEANDPGAEQEFKAMLLSLSEQLVEEINSQRQLMAAETGDLQVSVAEVSVTDLLRNLSATWSNAQAAVGRTVAIGNMPQTRITTDVMLLRRILGNMIKNALEATPEAGVVTILADDLGDHVSFAVHNAGSIPDGVRHQVFLRSFSTKGEGRGIGTYSIKLLGEKYLGGNVGFSSSAARGTTFVIRLPVQWPFNLPVTDE